MNLYIGDLDRKELLENIYEELRNDCLKFNANIMYPETINDGLMFELLNKNYIREIYGIYFNISFNNGYVSFSESNSRIFIEVVMKLKLLNGLINYNDYNFAIIKANEQKMQENQEQISINNFLMSKIVMSEDVDISGYMQESRKKIIKLDSKNIARYQYFEYWKDNLKLEREIFSLEYENSRIKYNLINKTRSLILKPQN